MKLRKIRILNAGPGIGRRVLQGLKVIMATGGFYVISAAAQDVSGSGTPSHAGWQEKWMGMYDDQDRPGRIAPPGYKVLYPPEPETIELVDSLSQPWARMRREATDFEIEDSGLLCRPTGPFRRAQTGDFELLVSPEKITVVGGSGGGFLTAGIRRIYLNRPHLRNPPLTYMGDWIGHWEGETLILDGIGFNAKTWLTRDRQRHTEALHILERWRLVSNEEWLEKTITVDDRFALTAPFTVTRYHRKLPNSTAQVGRVCLDTPEGRRAFLKLYRQYERSHEEMRKSMGTGRMPLEEQ